MTGHYAGQAPRPVTAALNGLCQCVLPSVAGARRVVCQACATRAGSPASSERASFVESRLRHPERRRLLRHGVILVSPFVAERTLSAPDLNRRRRAAAVATATLAFAPLPASFRAVAVSPLVARTLNNPLLVALSTWEQDLFPRTECQGRWSPNQCRAWETPADGTPSRAIRTPSSSPSATATQRR